MRHLFFKGLTKLANLPDYKCLGLICLALPPRQKFGLILIIKFFLVEVIKKIILIKNVRLTYYSSMKKNQKDSDDFRHRKLTMKVKFGHF